MAGYERITPDPNYNYKANLPNWPLVMGLLTGYFYGFATPILNKYPMKQGVIKYLPRGLVIGGALGFTVNYAFATYHEKQMRFAEEYIARNPEDFIEPPPQTFAELLLPWSPAR